MMNLFYQSPNGPAFLGATPLGNQITPFIAYIVAENEGAPSKADFWSMWITVNGKDIEAIPIAVPGFRWTPQGTSTVLQCSEDDDIKRNGIAMDYGPDTPALRGFYVAYFPLDVQTIASNATSIRAKFTDKFGTKYELPFVRGERESYIQGICNVVTPTTPPSPTASPT